MRDAASLGSSMTDIDRKLEAIFTVADEPQSPTHLAAALQEPVAVVKEAIERIRDDFDGADGGPARGFELREVGGGWRLYVRELYDDVVADFVSTVTPSKLSQAALETLAVIAYKQPITRGQVAAIRAVNVDSVVRTLMARGLVEEAFTDSDTGAIHYRTTDQLLSVLGINDITELPLISPLLPDAPEDDQ